MNENQEIFLIDLTVFGQVTARGAFCRILMKKTTEAWLNGLGRDKTILSSVKNGGPYDQPGKRNSWAEEFHGIDSNYNMFSYHCAVKQKLT
jgi:hypothetical protein